MRRRGLIGLALAGCSFSPSAAIDATSSGPADGSTSTDGDGQTAAQSCATDSRYDQSHGGHTYWYDTTNDDYDHLFEACAVGNGHLAAIDDLAENTFLHGLVPSGITAWFGLDDLVVEGQFRWVTHTALGTPTNWSPGEPNNANNDEDCAYMAPDGTWNDTNCGDNFRGGLCECETGYTAPLAPPCMTGSAGTIVNGRRYIVHTNALDWADAQADCQSVGAYLFVPSDDNENNIVQDPTKLDLGGVEVWIGLDENPAPFHWVNHAIDPYTKWAGGEPSGDVSKACVALETNSTWENLDCTTPKPYVCECDPNPPNADGS